MASPPPPGPPVQQVVIKSGPFAGYSPTPEERKALEAAKKLDSSWLDIALLGGFAGAQIGKTIAQRTPAVGRYAPAITGIAAIGGGAVAALGFRSYQKWSLREFLRSTRRRALTDQVLGPVQSLTRDSVLRQKMLELDGRR